MNTLPTPDCAQFASPGLFARPSSSRPLQTHSAGSRHVASSVRLWACSKTTDPGQSASPERHIGSTVRLQVLRALTIVIPPQHGTPDSCTASGDVETDERLSAKGLGVMGWIHVCSFCRASGRIPLFCAPPSLAADPPYTDGFLVVCRSPHAPRLPAVSRRSRGCCAFAKARSIVCSRTPNFRFVLTQSRQGADSHAIRRGAHHCAVMPPNRLSCT